MSVVCTLEITIDLPIGFPINNIISLSVRVHENACACVYSRMLSCECMCGLIIIFTVKFFRVLMRMCMSQYVYECMSVCAVSN